tara:strand:+ start:1007 stop:1651 length:645 start_codon:yes stop_codon:yes gene_type:complete
MPPSLSIQQTRAHIEAHARCRKALKCALREANRIARDATVQGHTLGVFTSQKAVSDSFKALDVATMELLRQISAGELQDKAAICGAVAALATDRLRAVSIARQLEASFTMAKAVELFNRHVYNSRTNPESLERAEKAYEAVFDLRVSELERTQEYDANGKDMTHSVNLVIHHADGEAPAKGSGAAVLAIAAHHKHINDTDRAALDAARAKRWVP